LFLCGNWVSCKKFKPLFSKITKYAPAISMLPLSFSCAGS
jgi:hypothetical protein